MTIGTWGGQFPWPVTGERRLVSLSAAGVPTNIPGFRELGSAPPEERRRILASVEGLPMRAIVDGDARPLGSSRTASLFRGAFS